MTRIFVSPVRVAVFGALAVLPSRAAAEAGDDTQRVQAIDEYAATGEIAVLAETGAAVPMAGSWSDAAHVQAGGHLAAGVGWRLRTVPLVLGARLDYAYLGVAGSRTGISLSDLSFDARYDWRLAEPIGVFVRASAGVGATSTLRSSQVERGDVAATAGGVAALAVGLSLPLGSQERCVDADARDLLEPSIAPGKKEMEWRAARTRALQSACANRPNVGIELSPRLHLYTAGQMIGLTASINVSF